MARRCDERPELTYAVIDKMTLTAPPEMSPLVPIIVSSVTDTQHLGETSVFGNAVADPRLRSTLLLKEDQGEMILSRDRDYLVTPPYHFRRGFHRRSRPGYRPIA